MEEEELALSRPHVNAKRRSGAQSGNQNARRHGYYSGTLDEQQRAALAPLPSLAGLDAQIQLLQVKAAFLRQRDPLNTKLFNAAIVRIAKLLEAKEMLERLEKDPVYLKSMRDAFLKQGISLDFGPFAKPDVNPAKPGKNEFRKRNEKRETSPGR